MTSDGQWSPERPYLNTASYGLPPRVAFDALANALDDWRAGRVSWEPWCESTERARASFARLNGVGVDEVAVGATTSELVGLVAAAIPDGASVLAVDGDFSSLLFPFVARELRVRTVPLDALADAIDGTTDVVAFSSVQSANGHVADLDTIATAARDAGALTVVDATQSCGWLPLDASRFDAVVCSGYKWLLSPRGTAYAYLGERLRERARPIHANWYAGEEQFGSYYGLPSRLASAARRFDTSPAWFSWVGAAPAVELLESIGIERIQERNVALANRFRAGLALEPSNTAIVSAEAADAHERLRAAGIQAATRAGGLRVSFHVYNTEDDVDAALDALGGDSAA
ncbi:MAG TPA: aminotransferase class V-fold PLP-dependent enzyme [Gaiellaceae bacterium]|nr:aminotransferase class V-fold PLP-dependent enzyme [Gaiellaceae bacterium]